jgi:hypothetical protein
MEIKKVIPEISDVTPINRIYPANLYFFKFFSLSIWLIIISIGLSVVAKSASAGVEDRGLYYRYVPYEGPKSTTGTTNQPQPPKQPSGANETEAKKTEQAPRTEGKEQSAEQAKDTAGMRSEEAKKTESSEQAKKPDESAGIGAANLSEKEEPAKNAVLESKQPSAPAGTSGQAPASGQNAPQPDIAKNRKTECPMAAGKQQSGTEKIPPVKRPEKDTGEFPSGEFPSFCQVDVNGDHYVTKDELQNFPELLRVFDKVDAGKDGRLEQHEFQNLEMETTREGEVS